MFDEIAAYAQSRDLKKTLYVDDMTISGAGANNDVLNAVRRIVARHGLRSHKLKQFSRKRPKIITGIVVTDDGIKIAELPAPAHLRGLPAASRGTNGGREAPGVEPPCQSGSRGGTN